MTTQEEDKWRQKMRLGDLEQNLPRATAKLRRHYAKLGFKLMKGTPSMSEPPREHCRFRTSSCHGPSNSVRPLANKGFLVTSPCSRLG